METRLIRVEVLTGKNRSTSKAPGRAVWRYDATPAEAGSYGFPGSPAVGAGLVFVTGLDGSVYAFAQ